MDRGGLSVTSGRYAPGHSFSVGFTIFIATLVVIAALFTVGGPGVLDRTVSYSVVVESANNVRKGSKVYLDGVAVGQVSSVAFRADDEAAPDPRNVVIEITITEQNRVRIREGTVAWLGSEGLLGDQVVELTTGDWARAAIPPGSEIPFVPRSLVGDLIGIETQANAENVLEELLRLLHEAQEGKGTLGKLIVDSTLHDRLTGVAAEAERALAAAADAIEGSQTGEAPLSELLLGEADSAALSRSIRTFAGLAARIDAEPSLAAALDPALAESSRSLASILDKVDRGEGSLGRFINDPTIADNLNNLFLGVREEPILRNLIRNAELSGRHLYAAAASRETQEARIRAAIAAQARLGEAAPIPAAATEPPGGALPADAEQEEER
jgi:phospholipid/cholesterol/gamma-HCH transport system substrate-binding protein